MLVVRLVDVLVDRLVDVLVVRLDVDEVIVDEELVELVLEVEVLVVEVCVDCIEGRVRGGSFETLEVEHCGVIPSQNNRLAS